MNIFRRDGKVIGINSIKKTPALLQNVINLTTFLPEDCELKERICYIKEGLKEVKACPYCGNRCAISTQKNLILNTCSSNICRNKYSGEGVSKRWSTYDFTKRNRKIKETCRKKYGVDNFNQLPEAWEKKQKTLIKHFGSLEKAKSEQTRKRLEGYKVKGITNNSSAHEMIIEKYLYHLIDYYKEAINDFIQNNKVNTIITYQSIDKVFDRFYKNLGFELESHHDDYFISHLGDKCYTCGINKWKLII